MEIHRKLGGAGHEGPVLYRRAGQGPIQDENEGCPTNLSLLGK